MGHSKQAIEQRIRAIAPERLRAIRRGIEKESLRVRADGALASSPHPDALGAPLTHPNVTTDFSESQLELITGVHASVDDCLAELTDIHQFVYRSIGDEMLWVSSMPCGLPDDDAIPIARYGRSNVALAKSVYREGLGHRYGRRMQTVSGIHYNWSMPGLSDADHFALIRNFRRHVFLLMTLFGASPAVCPCYVAGRDHDLRALASNTLGLPHATSLRMGRLGYQSEAQSSLAVSYNGLESYARSLHDALIRPYPPYEQIGVRAPDGSYRQLGTTLLQIENEFYSTIRPKRTIAPGERPLHALRTRGVEYVEVRCLDLNPFEPIGIDARACRFIDIFLLHCLHADSPPDTPPEIAAMARNQEIVAARGREPGLLLESGEQQVRLLDWARELLEQCGPIADALDAAHGADTHSRALEAAFATMADLERTPSARVLAAIAAPDCGSYTEFVRARSARTREQMLAKAWRDDIHAKYSELSVASIRKRDAIEAADRLDFETYRREYLDPAGL